MAAHLPLKIHFTDYFQVTSAELDAAGAFNISLINDLPLFIDPFLLFNSEDAKYQQLHDGIIRYLRFLRDKAAAGGQDPGLIAAWYTFKEVKQTWLGFSLVGNQGRGLGTDFARELNKNLHSVFSEFGSEKVTKGSHLEKLCLIREGVGRDSISDFTTTLTKEYLLEYTQEFATSHVAPNLRKRVAVPRVRFNYATESWEQGSYDLPWLDGDYVILTPKNLLTKDDTWINRSDMIGGFDEIVDALPNAQLRAQLNNYLRKTLPEKPSKTERRYAVQSAVLRFPEFIEYYIRNKEDTGELATPTSKQKVDESQQLFVRQVREFVADLFSKSAFYSIPGNTIAEARSRVGFLKDVIENKGGFRIFYVNGEPVRRESDLHILFRLTWFATPSDVSREVDDGRGPADFKISRGLDKTIIEFKLATNTHLKQNLQKQTELYQQASDAQGGLKVVVYFTIKEFERVDAILGELGLRGHRNIVLIDARRDNKPSASKA